VPARRQGSAKEDASERSEASHANRASRRSGSRESVWGSPRGEAPRSDYLTSIGTAVSVPLMHWSADARPLTASDGELARAIASASPGAAQDEESELYRRFAYRVRLYGLKHLRDEAAADDLVQQVLLTTIERLRAGEVRNPDEIGSFILGTSRMLADSTSRKARRREKLTAQFHVQELYADPVVASSDVEVVERCLHRLGERDRRVLVLTFYVEKTSSEIARELGVTGTVIRVARHRALERLRECVGLQRARTA